MVALRVGTGVAPTLGSGCATQLAASPLPSITPSTDLSAITVSDTDQPEVTIPTPWGIDKTQSKVLRPGGEQKLTETSTVTLNYVGLNGRTGEIFDSSYDRGAPATFQLQSVVPGFAKGLMGQAVGSRVLIAMPSEDGYADGNPGAGPLPVSYYAFSASRQGNGRVVLEWATAAEQQNAYFEVQRSTDAQVFEAIGRVASQGGNSIRRQAYGFTDAAAPAGLTLYYRLQQFDTDGTTSLSRVMAVAAGWQQALGVYPNPATDLLALDLPAGKPQGVVVRSLSGVEMSRFGSGQPVRVGQLAPGVYLLEVQTADGQRASVRFVKQ